MTARIFTRGDLREVVVPEVWRVLEGWLDAGKGVAIYQNRDLGHRMVGHRQFISFGTPEAQIEDDALPTRLPDIGTSINFRYILEGTCRDGNRGQ